MEPILEKRLRWCDPPTRWADNRASGDHRPLNMRASPRFRFRLLATATTTIRRWRNGSTGKLAARGMWVASVYRGRWPTALGRNRTSAIFPPPAPRFLVNVGNPRGCFSSWPGHPLLSGRWLAPIGISFIANQNSRFHRDGLCLATCQRKVMRPWSSAPRIAKDSPPATPISVVKDHTFDLHSQRHGLAWCRVYPASSDLRFFRFQSMNEYTPVAAGRRAGLPSPRREPDDRLALGASRYGRAAFRVEAFALE